MASKRRNMFHKNKMQETENPFVIKHNLLLYSDLICFLLCIHLVKRNRVASSITVRTFMPSLYHKARCIVSNLSVGGLAVGVPGELRGYEAVYKRFGGKAPWRELFEDTIALCRSGITVNRHLADTFDTHKKSIQNNPTLAEVFLNDNGEVPSMGDMIRMPKLADTLAIVADHGADAIYNGSLTKQLVEEIRAAGGIITEEDMANYHDHWTPLLVEKGIKLFDIQDCLAVEAAVSAEWVMRRLYAGGPDLVRARVCSKGKFFQGQRKPAVASEEGTSKV
ncbi:hypothetical protein AAG570_000960 [Ranatra chinensis]|uniref:Uncharacterized protein n=1 Tax=Ranatra chinensis TaxID=642074 RepID=A0ABD0Z0Q7_9HEMI